MVFVSKTSFVDLRQQKGSSFFILASVLFFEYPES